LTLGKAADEVRDQSWNVFRALTERGHANREHVQPVEQIGAERALLNHLRQVLIRGRNHPDIDLRGAAAASETLDLLLLQCPEELGLQLQRQVADLVEKQRAPIRSLEATHALCDGAGKCAPLITKELTLQQPGGERGAIHGHERLPPPWPSIVNGSRDELFTRSGLSKHEDGAVDSRDEGRGIHHCLEGQAASDQRTRHEHSSDTTQSTLVCGSCDVFQQLAAIERLQHEGNRAISHRSSSDVVVVMRGDEHDRQLWPFMSDPGLQLDAVDAG